MESYHFQKSQAFSPEKLFTEQEGTGNCIGNGNCNGTGNGNADCDCDANENDDGDGDGDQRR